MLKIENTEVLGWEHAIRGMRNPMNSWEKSDSNLYHASVYFDECNKRWETNGHRFMIGPNDLDLMTRLRNAGTDHRKFMRMIAVYVDGNETRSDRVMIIYSKTGTHIYPIRKEDDDET